MNEALDLILDHGTGENENIKPEEVAKEETILHDNQWPNRNFLPICHQILFLVIRDGTWEAKHR